MSQSLSPPAAAELAAMAEDWLRRRRELLRETASATERGQASGLKSAADELRAWLQRAAPEAAP
jgi:hypothetical protein